MRFFVSLLLALIFVAVSASAKHHHRPTVYILRHGEKSPNSQNHQLNWHGYERAECLRSVFGEESPYDIGYILAPHVSKGEYLQKSPLCGPKVIDSISSN